MSAYVCAHESHIPSVLMSCHYVAFTDNSEWTMALLPEEAIFLMITMQPCPFQVFLCSSAADIASSASSAQTIPLTVEECWDGFVRRFGVRFLLRMVVYARLRHGRLDMNVKHLNKKRFVSTAFASLSKLASCPNLPLSLPLSPPPP